MELNQLNGRTLYQTEERFLAVAGMEATNRRAALACHRVFASAFGSIYRSRFCLKGCLKHFAGIGNIQCYTNSRLNFMLPDFAV